MKNTYIIRLTTQHGNTIARVTARRLTTAVRLALETTKARSFSAITSITRAA